MLARAPHSGGERGPSEGAWKDLVSFEAGDAPERNETPELPVGFVHLCDPFDYEPPSSMLEPIRKLRIAKAMAWTRVGSYLFKGAGDTNPPVAHRRAEALFVVPDRLAPRHAARYLDCAVRHGEREGAIEHPKGF